MLFFRPNKDVEKEILEQIQRCTKIVNHNMINQQAFILAHAEKEQIDIQRFKSQVIKDMEGWFSKNSCEHSHLFFVLVYKYYNI